MSEIMIGAPPIGELEQEFLDFHAANPQVYTYVKRYAAAARSVGYTKFAIACIWERVRWELMITTVGAEFVLPNNHRAYYARLLMRDDPLYEGFFRIAMLRSIHKEAVDRYGRVI